MIGEYLKSAPNFLVTYHKERKKFLGRRILGCLLTDTSMKRSWTELGKHIKTNQEWERFWKEIIYILRCSRKKPILRTKKNETFLKIAKQANDLAQSIKEGVLDLRVYEVFPDEVMKILRITNWENLDSLQRSDSANKLLIEWPTVPELLIELESRAKKLADEAMTEKRVIERNSLDYEVRYFAGFLVTYLIKTYETKSYRTVVNITNVVLNSNIDESIVKNAVKKG